MLNLKEYARIGFSHVEVNALACDRPIEKGVPGEFYPEFYCPALDQFASSSLNKGIYTEKYLERNRKLLKSHAKTALKYGLVPGLLCFEPRSVPEEIFKKYPTLRGARVDHPFRSFKPRYNLSVVHPAVKEHYAEMLTNIMKEIPELEFMTIWTNDSGAGFEYTKSLYVGRNGGAYLIREWKDDEDIARALFFHSPGGREKDQSEIQDHHPARIFLRGTKASVVRTKKRSGCGSQFLIDLRMGKPLQASGLL